jgi:hypothetical protein
MGDRRPTIGQNWRVREAVGIRQPRPRIDYGVRVRERLEDELRQIERQREQDDTATRGPVKRPGAGSRRAPSLVAPGNLGPASVENDEAAN